MKISCFCEVIDKLRLREAYRNLVLFTITMYMNRKNIFTTATDIHLLGDQEHPAKNKYESIFAMH